VHCRGSQAFAIILGCLLCRRCECLQSRYRVSTRVTQYHESSTRRCRVIRPIPVRKSRPLIRVWASEISRLLGQAPIESKSVAGQVVTTEIRCDVGRWSLIEESEASPHGAASEWSVPVSRRCPFRHRTSPPTCPASALPSHLFHPPRQCGVVACCNPLIYRVTLSRPVGSRMRLSKHTDIAVPSLALLLQ
jgi:hypothetical protein